MLKRRLVKKWQFVSLLALGLLVLGKSVNAESFIEVKQTHQQLNITHDLPREVTNASPGDILVDDVLLVRNATSKEITLALSLKAANEKFAEVATAYFQESLGSHGEKEIEMRLQPGEEQRRIVIMKLDEHTGNEFQGETEHLRWEIELLNPKDQAIKTQPLLPQTDERQSKSASFGIVICLVAGTVLVGTNWISSLSNGQR